MHCEKYGDTSIQNQGAKAQTAARIAHQQSTAVSPLQLLQWCLRFDQVESDHGGGSGKKTLNEREHNFRFNFMLQNEQGGCRDAFIHRRLLVPNEKGHGLQCHIDPAVNPIIPIQQRTGARLLGSVVAFASMEAEQGKLRRRISPHRIIVSFFPACEVADHNSVDSITERLPSPLPSQFDESHIDLYLDTR